MKVGPPNLLPLLRSAFQGEMLACLFLHPDTEFSLTELAARCGVSQATVSREADRFVGARLITDRRQGNLRLLRANAGTPIAGPLAEPVVMTDPVGAYQPLYDAARKALCAVLENQGLRATSRGGHIAVFESVSAQLDPPARPPAQPDQTSPKRP